ncbi:hypothetical protein, partial [Gottfriedia luciferensis]|uniref:hypothetical protein n=1 Tax=Gottfriedia luciferensis TaxID=178774 RepID=UPI001ABFA69C
FNCLNWKERVAFPSRIRIPIRRDSMHLKSRKNSKSGKAGKAGKAGKTFTVFQSTLNCIKSFSNMCSVKNQQLSLTKPKIKQEATNSCFLLKEKD